MNFLANLVTHPSRKTVPGDYSSLVSMLSATVLRTSSSTGGDEVEGQYIPGWKADEEEKLLPSDDGCPYRRRFHPREEQRMGVKVFRSRVSGGSTLVSMFCLGRGGGGGGWQFCISNPHPRTPAGSHRHRRKFPSAAIRLHSSRSQVVSLSQAHANTTWLDDYR